MAVTVLYFQGVVIGLEVSAMTVSESSGSIEAVVKVLSGVLSTPVMVTFSTLSRTALGQSWAYKLFVNYMYVLGVLHVCGNNDARSRRNMSEVGLEVYLLLTLYIIVVNTFDLTVHQIVSLAA